MVQISHPYMTTGKTIALTLWTSVSKMMSLAFNMLSRFVIAFLPRAKCLLISWLQSPFTVIWEPKKIMCHCSHFFSQVFALSDDMILAFWMLIYKPAFSLPSFTFINRLFISSLLSAIMVVSEVIDISPGNLYSSLSFIQPDISHDVLCI